MQLDEIAKWIDTTFGEVSPQPARSDIEALTKILGDAGYQRYLQDQTNRKIIRDYLTNAVVLGEITEGGLAAFAPQLVSEDSRATLALFMLMSSIEEVRDLPLGEGDFELLKPLSEQPEKQPYIKLVPN